MSDVLVSQSATWDPKIGNFVTTTTLENLQQFPSIPSGAVDVTKSVQDGVYRVTYKNVGDGTSGGGTTSSSYNYELHSSVSTEPLLTFAYFQPGGAWALSDADKDKIKAAEADPKLWKSYLTGSTGLAKYAELILKGVESYFAPTATLTITADENSVPDLSQLGRVVTVSNAPTCAPGGNWLFSGCNFSALQNNKWRVSREYRASGRGGWNADLYGS